MAKPPMRITAILAALSRGRFKYRLRSFAIDFWKWRKGRCKLQAEVVRQLASGPSMRFRRLETRRVLNASFVFNGVDALLLSNFDDVGGTTTLDMSFDAVENDYVFTLDGGVWNAGGGNVLDPDIIGEGSNILRVDRLLFEGLGDGLDLQILDDNVTPNDIDLNVTLSGATPIDLPNSPTSGIFVIDVAGNVSIDAALNTLGSELTITAGGTINSTANITTADLLDSGEASGALSLSAVGDISLAGDLDTSGADHSAAGAIASSAGQINILTSDGSVTLANLIAAGGDATGGGGSTGGAGGTIQVTAGDAGADELHNIVMNGLVTTIGGSGDTAGAGANVSIIADHDLTIDGAILSGGGNVDLVAGGNIISSASGSITTTSGLNDGVAGNIQISAAVSVDLTGTLTATGAAVDGAGGNITIAASAGSITVANIDANGIGIGTGGNIVLDANGDFSDVNLNGGLLTNGLGFVTITADDAVVFATTGNIATLGTGDVSVTANTTDSAGDSGDGITMAVGSFIDLGAGLSVSGALLLQSTGGNGGPIAARALTTRNNTIQIDSGDSLTLLGAISSLGGAVDLDAASSIDSTVAATITTRQAAESGLASGSVAIDAGSNIELLAAIDTSGADHSGPGATASAAGEVTIATLDGAISLAAIDASGGNATGGGASTGGAGASVRLTTADAGADDLHDVTLNGNLDVRGGTGATVGAAGNASISSDNNLVVGGTLTAGTGNVLLVAGGNVTQSSAIIANGLGLIVDGTTTLNGLANQVMTLAADNGGEIQFTNLIDLSIGAVTVDATSVEDVVTLGDITLIATAISDGDALPDSNDPDVSGANVTLTATTGSIAVVGNVFAADVNPLEVVASGNLIANATMGALALAPTVAGITTLNSPHVALFSTGTLLIDDLIVVGDLRIEANDVVANDASIDLTANRILFVSGQAETITVTAAILDARTAGNLTVNSTTAIELLDLDGDNVALATTTSDGAISLIALGTITVSDDVIAGMDGATNSTGVIQLTAVGLAANLWINDVVLSDDGNITLRADNDVRIGDPVTLSGNDNLIVPNNDDLFVVTTINGNIAITADFDDSGSGEFFMVDGARVIAGRDVALDYLPNVDGLASISVIELGNTPKVAGQSQIEVRAEGDVTLGSLQSANAGADALRVTSLAGRIVDGGDLHVDLVANFSGGLTTLRSANGTGDSNALETSLFAIDALNEVAGTIAINEVAAGGDLNVVQADNSGDIRIRVDGGSLTVVASSFTPANGDFGVTTISGHILLEAAVDVIVDHAVTSDTGHVTIDAGDDVFVNAAVATGAAGDIYITAGNSNANDSPAPQVDGINIDGTLDVADGSILLRSQLDIRTTQDITSAGGDVGLLAANDLLQGGDVVATAGSVSIDVGNNLTMQAGSVTTAADNIVANASGSITLRSLTATHVGLIAGQDMLDGDATSTINVTATNLSLRAGGSIGASDLGSPATTNNQAIDTDVATLAVSATDGVYLLNQSDLVIGSVNAISVTVDAQRLNWAGPLSNETATVTVGALAGGSVNPGPLKIVVSGGALTVDEAIAATGAGDVLLQSLTNVTLNAAIDGGTGHATVRAGDTPGDHLLVNATITTGGSGDILLQGYLITVDAAISSGAGDIGLVSSGGDILQNTDITTAGGDVWIDAGQDYIMLATVIPDLTTTSTSNGDMLIRAGRDVRIAALDAGLGNIAISAGRDILDENADERINVIANALSLRAEGLIGGSDLVNLPENNLNAIDTTLNILAATSQHGIYLQETDALIIDQVSVINVSVTQANFNSSTTVNNDSLAALSDLTTTVTGPIKIVTLAGILTVNDGLDGNDTGISAAGNADILLDARGLGGDIITTTAIVSGEGNITLRANDNVDLGDDVRTGGSATILVSAANGFLSVADGPDADSDGITSDTGHILLRAQLDITLNATVSSNSGNIGVHSANHILQNANISTGLGDVLLTSGGDTLMAATAAPSVTTSSGGGNVIVAAVGDIVLGQINAGSGNVALDAGGDILDANADSRINVTAANLAMVAVGTIGESDVFNLATANANAINTSVDRIAAQSAVGIYIQEVNGIVIDHVEAFSVTVEVNQVYFRSDTTAVVATLNSTAREDLTTTNNGHIKIVSLAGNIIANDGTDGDSLSISAHGLGDVLVSAGGDVIVNAQIVSTSGDITLAGQLIDINADITTTGMIFLSGTDINLDATLTSSEDLLLLATNDIVLNSLLQLGAGNIGLDAGRDVLQNANIEALTGDVFASAGRDINMALGTHIRTNTGNILLDAGGDVALTRLDAGTGSASVEAQLGSIINFRADNQPNVIATTLRMVAGNLIGAADIGNGTPTQNANAIVADVETLAANGNNGIYVLGFSGDLAIDSVVGFTVTVASTRVNFNSTSTPAIRAQSHATLADLQAISGPIKLVVQAGSLTLNEGGDGDNRSVTSAGDILLEARGPSSDIVIVAAGSVQAANGHITLIAGDDIQLSADITSQGTGTIYLLASNQTAGAGITMAAGTSISAANQNIRLAADNEGNVTLALLDAGTAAASVVAEGSIIHGNAGANNIVAGTLRLFADAVINADGMHNTLVVGNGVGAIGSLVNPLRTTVDQVAAQSSTGIYLNELDAIEVTATGTIEVSQAHFNSTRSTMADSSLSDLVTTANGTVHLISGGAVTLSDGTDADGIAVSAHGTGSIRIDAAEDMVVNASVVNHLGSIGLLAGGTLSTFAQVSSTTGDIFLYAEGNLDIDADPAAEIDIDIHSVIRTAGDIRLEAVTGEIRGSALSNIIADNLILSARQYVHLPHTDVNTLTADISGSIDTLLVDPTWQNGFANLAGQRAIDDILRGAGNPTPIGDTPLFDALRDEFAYINRFESSYALFIRNSGELTLNASVFANAISLTGDQAAVYIETINGDLTIADQVMLTSTLVDGAGIVLIAGQQLAVQAAIQTQSLDGSQLVNNTQLNATIHDGGQVAVPFSTEFVIAADAIISENSKSHVLQRVSMEFGNAGEAGFLTIVHYADGTFQLFDSQQDVASLVFGSEFLLEPSIAGNDPMLEAATTKLFARATPFTDSFLRDNFMLPTDALARRSLDFFMFSNADSQNANLIVDEAAFADSVEGVFSTNIIPGLAFVIETPSIQIPQTISTPIFVTIEVPPQQPAPEVELPSQAQNDVEVAIYRVDYQDLNEDGQVDEEELPSFETVLEEELDDERMKTRKVIKPAEAGETPTQDDIAREKNKLLNDPTQPSGAYAIIKEDTDGNRTVLDVFSIRDWPEEQVNDGSQSDGGTIPQLPPLHMGQPRDAQVEQRASQAEVVPAPLGTVPLEPAPNEKASENTPLPNRNDSSHLAPPERHTPQFASASLLLGSLWMLRQRQSASTAGDQTSSPPATRTCDASHDYSRRARKRRSLNNRH